MALKENFLYKSERKFLIVIYVRAIFASSSKRITLK